MMLVVLHPVINNSETIHTSTVIMTIYENIYYQGFKIQVQGPGPVNNRIRLISINGHRVNFGEMNIQ